MGATLRARIWDMLGLNHKAGKEDIRRAYKEFVRLSHPDLNNGKQPEGYNERFQRLTTEYNAVMKMDDNEFWLEQFDCGATRLATKRVDGPSLNPWERRFRTWARANDLLEVDDLEDGDLDCRKRAKLYLDCEDDPSAPGCQVPPEMSAQWQDREEPMAAASEPSAAPKNSGGIRFEQVVAVIAFTLGALIIAAFVAIVASVLQG